MATLDDLFYNLHIKDFTQAELESVNKRLANLGENIKVGAGVRRQIEDALKTAVKITFDPQIKATDIEAKLADKVTKLHLTPVVDNLQKAVSEAIAAGGQGTKIPIPIDEQKIKDAVTRVLSLSGYKLTVDKTTGLEQAIKTVLQGDHQIHIKADPTQIQNSIITAVQNVITRGIDVVLNKKPIRDSVMAALQEPFYITVKVKTGATRAAVQNAINQGAPSSLDYKRLMEADAKAARAELDRVRAAHIQAGSAAKAHTQASISLGDSMRSNFRIAGELGSAFASLYSIHAAKQFLSQIIEIGGELEHQKIALETIYGSGSKMESLYSQIKGLARQSPFGVMDLTKNIKQLSAYGVKYNEVYDTAKRLADISAATSVDIQRLILAFGKTKNRTFLDGLEAKQFAYANIPIYDALSKKLTELEGKFVSVRDVMGRIKKREIGFDMVKEILWDMTDEGGKFYNMQERLAGSVKTSWKLVRDNIELMFGEMAEGPIGEWLKSLGQTLQGATQQWKTFFSILQVGIPVFGLYRLAMMGMNAHLDANMKNAAAAALSQKKLDAARLRAEGLTRRLTAAEQQLIATRNRLTAAELKQMMAEGKLTAHQVQRLFLSGKISAATLRQAAAMGVLDKRIVQSIIGVNTMNTAWKRFIFTTKGIGSTIGNALGNILPMIFNWTTAIFGAIAGLTWLIHRNNEETERAEALGKAIYDKASDASKALTGMFDTFEDAATLSDLELTQGIEEMENTIKDLSPRPIDDINESLVTQDGHVRTLAERYDFLVGKIDSLKEGYDTLKSYDFGVIIERSMKGTNEGWFWDDLRTNAKDYTNALKKGEASITTFATKFRKAMERSVGAALEADMKFFKATKGMESYEEKMKFLVDNQEKFALASGAFSQKLNAISTLYDGIGDFGNRETVKAAYDEMVSDTQKFIKQMNAEMSMKGINPKKMTDAQRSAMQISLNEMLNSMEEASAEAKGVIAGVLEDFYKISLKEDRIKPALSEAFGNAMKNSAEEGLKMAANVLRYEGYNALSKGQKESVDKLMEEVKKNVMEKLHLTHGEMARFLQNNPLKQVISLVFQEGTQKPSELLKQMVAKRGYPGLTPEVNQRGLKWFSSGKITDAISSAQDEGKQLKAEMEALKKEGGEAYKKAEEAFEEWQKAVNYFDLTLNIDNSKTTNNYRGGGGHDRDPLASGLKAKFADLRDGWDEVQKLAKSIGSEPAFRQVDKSSIFSYFPWGEGPKTLRNYREEINKLRIELYKAGVSGHPMRESLYNEMTKKIFELDRTLMEQDIEKALEEVEAAYERQVANFNLYEKLRNATGNEGFAYTFSFGMEESPRNYEDMVREHFRKLSEAAKKAVPASVTMDFDLINESNVGELPEELQKAWREARKDIQKYRDEQRDAVAEMIKDYETASQKIAAIEAEAAEKMRKVNSSALTAEQKHGLNEKIKARRDYDIFTQSAEYLQFFSGIYALTEQEATRIGDLIRANLDRQLQAGTLSAKDYYEEIGKIREQLDKIRSLRSPGMTYLKDGVSGLHDRAMEQNESKRLKITQEIADIEEEMQAARERNDMNALVQLSDKLRLAQNELKAQLAIRDALVKNKEAWEDVLSVANIADNIAQGLSDAFGAIRDMADAFGVDVETDGWLDAGGVLETLTSLTSGVKNVVQSAMNGDIGGILSGAVSTLTAPFTIWSQIHDKKLQKRIEASQKQYEKWQGIIDKIERRMDRFLGNTRNIKVVDVDADRRKIAELKRQLSGLSEFERKIGGGVLAENINREIAKTQKRVSAYETGGALGYQRQLMAEQLEELEYQKRLEEDKKKSDASAIEDYNDQIDEMRVAIREFAEEMASLTYGIDLNDWASDIGDALVDAFAKGEDAAEAFDKTVGDILRSMVKKMASADIIAPMFADLRDYLFGSDGLHGVYGEDFYLSPEEVSGMKTYLDKIKDEGIPAVENLFNAINDATGGLLEDVDSADTSVRGGIQALTENTGDLLASYINAIRAYCAESNVNFDTLVKETMPRLTAVAEAQLTQLTMITENTRRNMLAAEAMRGTLDSMEGMLGKATRSKDAGFYVK